MAAVIDKSVLGLLNGLAKREYYEETDITDEFLQQELFADMDEQSFKVVMARFEGLLKTLVISDMDFKQLEAFLTSQIKRRESPLTEEQASAVTKFWRNHKMKIHNILVEKSNFSNKLKQMNWRIDLKTQGRHLDQINTPTAIFELQIERQGENLENSETKVGTRFIVQVHHEYTSGKGGILNEISAQRQFRLGGM